LYNFIHKFCTFYSFRQKRLNHIISIKRSLNVHQQWWFSKEITSTGFRRGKIWGFHFSDYEESRLLRNENPVRTSQETHYISATESSRIMLCKIWSLHGTDYEECRLLECKYPFRTAQGTHYVSAREHSRFMLYKIWSCHGSDYEECVFWDVMPCGSCENRSFGGTYRLHHQDGKNWRARYNFSSN
jgi:hypothetical protein